MLSRVNWIASTLLISTPILAIYGLLFVPITWPTLLFTLFWYLCTGLGITAGYHRLWSHRAYKAAWGVRFLLMIFGSGALQGSIRWWGRNHRIHHRYTDTPLDPYNARQGFLYSHFGWMLMTKDWSKLKRPQFDLTDLESDPMVMWQNRNYWWVAPTVAFVFPTLLCGLAWGDWMGGYFFGAVLRTVMCHHATFCVNSLAHWLGQQPFADEHTPRDHFLTALVTLGEGYHNFHHEFPYDYRNAIQWYQYDPTKWLILLLQSRGWAWDLKQYGSNEVQMGVWEQRRKQLEQAKAQHAWPPKDAELPRMDWWEYQGRCHNGEKLVVIGAYVVRLGEWLQQHPGESLAPWIGQDATEAWAKHPHTPEAQGALALLRVAHIERAQARARTSPQ